MINEGCYLTYALNSGSLRYRNAELALDTPGFPPSPPSPPSDPPSPSSPPPPPSLPPSPPPVTVTSNSDTTTSDTTTSDTTTTGTKAITYTEVSASMTMSGAVDSWDDTVKTSFREAVASTLGGGLTKANVRVDAVTAASVRVAFTVLQPSDYNGVGVEDKLNNVGVQAALSKNVESATGFAVESAPQVASSASVTDNSAHGAEEDVTFRNTIIAVVAAVCALMCAGGASWYYFKVFRQKPAGGATVDNVANAEFSGAVQPFAN